MFYQLYSHLLKVEVLKIYYRITDDDADTVRCWNYIILNVINAKFNCI